MLARMNSSLSERHVEGHFLCMIYALWEEDRNRLRIANSGLPRPIFCHNGRVQRVDVAGLPLGMFEKAEYDEVTYHPQVGDLFVFFSDGIIDACNREGELFGRTRVEQVVEQNCDRPALEVVDALFRAVADHSAGEDLYDDCTVVALRVTKPAAKSK